MKLDLTVNRNVLPGFVTPVALLPREVCEALIVSILAEFCLDPADVYCVEPRSESIEVVAYLDEEDEEEPKVPLFFRIKLEDYGEYGAPLDVFFGREEKMTRLLFEARLEIQRDSDRLRLKGEVETAPKPDTPMGHGRYFPPLRKICQWRDGWENGQRLAPTFPSPVYEDDPLYLESLLMSAGSRGAQIEDQIEGASSTAAYAAGFLTESFVDSIDFQHGVRDAYRGNPRSVNPIEEVKNPEEGGAYLLGYDKALEVLNEVLNTED